MIKVGDPILAEVRRERRKTVLCCLFRNQLKEGGNDGIFLSVDGLGMKEKRENHTNCSMSFSRGLERYML